MSLSFLSIALLISGAEIAALTSITEYSRNKKIIFLLLASLIYGTVVPYLIYSSLLYSAIGTVNLMWNLMTTIGMFVIGRLVFNDNVTRWHILSLLMGIASMSLLFIAEKNP